MKGMFNKKSLKIAQVNTSIRKYIYYQPEVRRGEYWGVGVYLLQYSPLVDINEKYCIKIEY